MPPASEGFVRVMLVEEHDDSRETVAMALRLAGFEVSAVASPLEALAAVVHVRPHVVVTSIAFPGMSGEDLARLLRQKPPDRRPAIVAATGLSDPIAEGGGLFDLVLIKPLDVDELAAHARRLAGGGGAA